MTTKRVLVVNTVQIGETSGTGNTLKNLFALYPQDHQMQLVVYPDTGQQAYSDTCSFFTPISVCAFPYKIHVEREKKRRATEKGAKPKKTALNAGISKRGLKPAIHEMINGMLDMWPVKCDALFHMLDQFKPEVIYTCAASIRIMKIAKSIAEHYKIPIVIHLMDDWPNTIYSSSVLSYPARRSALKELKTIYRLSETNLAISDGLSEKYEAWSGKKHLTLMNPVEVTCDIDLMRDANDCVKFLYAGSLSLNRDESLVDVAQALSELRDEGFSNQFDIYTANTQNTQRVRNEFEQYGVQVFDYVSQNQVLELYRSYDVLVFTESFARELTAFTAHSLSTKIPEYMASGRPILGYLPEMLYSTSFLSKHKVAAIVNQKNELKKRCRTLIENSEYRQELARKSVALADTLFSNNVAKEKLELVFKGSSPDEVHR